MCQVCTMPVASTQNPPPTFLKWCSSLCFASFSSSQRLVKASLTAALCILRSSDMSWRILSIKARRLMEASFSRSALSMLSWLNLAHVSGVEALEEEENGGQIGHCSFVQVTFTKTTWSWFSPFKTVVNLCLVLLLHAVQTYHEGRIQILYKINEFLFINLLFWGK